MRKWIAILFVIGFLAGCGTFGGQPDDREEARPRAETKDTQPHQRLNLEKEDARTIAARLERIAESVPQVNSAVCVVFGKTAIVGIDVDAGLDRSRVGTIKYSVAEALRKDPAGINAVVTADLDLGARLREIVDEIRKGRPVSAFANELADIVGRLMPQFPRDTAPRRDIPRGAGNPAESKDRPAGRSDAGRQDPGPR